MAEAIKGKISSKDAVSKTLKGHGVDAQREEKQTSKDVDKAKVYDCQMYLIHFIAYFVLFEIFYTSDILRRLLRPR